MYVEKGKSISEQAIKDYLEKHYPAVSAIEDLRAIKRVSKKTGDANILQQAARELYSLNEAMLNDYEVWADCEKWPRGNLDTGKHWYQIWFLGIEPIEKPYPHDRNEYSLSELCKPVRHHFWALLFMDRNPSSQGYGYGFSSGAIGISRLFDATNHIFTILKNMGGCYGQLS